MDKVKLRSLNKLAEKGFDTAKRIAEIDMVTIRDYGLVGEISFIIEIQEALKNDVIAFLFNAGDEKIEAEESYEGRE